MNFKIGFSLDLRSFINTFLVGKVVFAKLRCYPDNLDLSCSGMISCVRWNCTLVSFFYESQRLLDPIHPSVTIIGRDFRIRFRDCDDEDVVCTGMSLSLTVYFYLVAAAVIAFITAWNLYILLAGFG